MIPAAEYKYQNGGTKLCKRQLVPGRKMADRLRIETDPLSAKTAEKAKNELRETPDNVQKGLSGLRELLKKEPDLNYPDREDILIRYLRPTKYYPESALALMKSSADFRVKHKNVLDKLMPANLEQAIVGHDNINVFADRDQDGRRILLAKVGETWNTKEVTNEMVFQLFYLVHQAALLEPETQVNGVVVILDFDGLGMKQVAALTPSFSLLLLTFIQDAMPLRLKEVHIINQPFIFNMVWQIFKPFIKEKLSKRLSMHGTGAKAKTSLHKHLDPAFLPEDYGGKLPKINYTSKDWYPIIRKFDHVVEENNTFGWKNK